jgi:opacity protein-like surface antigen
MNLNHVLVLSAAILAGTRVVGAEGKDVRARWTVRLDLGGTIAEDAALTEFAGPVSDAEFTMDPGIRLDAGAGYRITPWLEVGPELGFVHNSVNSIGDWHNPDATLAQLQLFMNVVIEYPPSARIAPFIGAGGGGVASFLTFGESHSHYYYYDSPDGWGNAFVLGFQGFGGLRYRFNDEVSMGVIYRYLQTEGQRWNVDWWDGSDFVLAVDSVRVHSWCLVLTAAF